MFDIQDNILYTLELVKDYTYYINGMFLAVLTTLQKYMLLKKGTLRNTIYRSTLEMKNEKVF